MSDAIIAAVVNWIVREEGGVADVGDGAGLTRWGQTEGWLTHWGLPVPTSRAEAESNYRKWLTLTHLDALCDEELLATVVADYAVNAGERPAIRALQRAVGAEADGILGPMTVDKLRTVNRREMALLVLAERMEYNGSVIALHPDRLAKFAKGWAARLGRQVRRIARGIPA